MENTDYLIIESLYRLASRSAITSVFHARILGEMSSLMPEFDANIRALLLEKKNPKHIGTFLSCNISRVPGQRSDKEIAMQTETGLDTPVSQTVYYWLLRWIRSY